MKLISWNVNGLRACMGKGFMEFFEEADADIFCIQEKQAAGRTDLPGAAGLSSVLELCGKEGLFRDSCFHKKRTAFRFLWNRDRGA